MNIFENYLSEINNVILKNKEFLNLENLENLKNVNLEVPPESSILICLQIFHSFCLNRIKSKQIS